MSTQPDSRSRTTRPDSMDRVTVRVPGEDLADLESVVENSEEYPNRSEAIREAIRQLVTAETRGEDSA